MVFVEIAEVKDLSLARVLIAALRAHGFHPLESRDGGLPGLPGLRGLRTGIPIEVPEEEEADARLLATALIRDMSRPEKM